MMGLSFHVIVVGGFGVVYREIEILLVVFVRVVI